MGKLVRTLALVRCENKKKAGGFHDVMVEAFHDPDVPGLALTRTKDGWSITHLQSRMRISKFSRRRRDLEALLQIAAEMRDWSKALPKVGGQSWKKLESQVKTLLQS